MSINETQAIVMILYLIFFIIMVVFFEIRLNYIHARHVEKIWPVGEGGLQIIDKKLKIITRIIFCILFIISMIIILTLL